MSCPLFIGEDGLLMYINFWHSFVITRFLVNVKHERQVDVVPRKFLSEEVYRIDGQLGGSGQEKSREVFGGFGFLRTVHYQGPCLVIGVKNVRVVNSFI